jgi:hypothetical protein
MKNVKINITSINTTKKSPPGAIVGGAIGGAAFLLVIAAVILFWRRRKAPIIIDPYDTAYPSEHSYGNRHTSVSQKDLAYSIFENQMSDANSNAVFL